MHKTLRAIETWRVRHITTSAVRDEMADADAQRHAADVDPHRRTGLHI
jgi:hypothetical protein